MSEIRSDDPEIQTSTKLRRRILRMIKEEDASNWSVLHACLFIVAEVTVDMPDREEGVATVHRKLDEMLAMLDSIGATTQ